MASKARESSEDFDTLSSAGNNNPYGIWSDSTTLWVVDELDNKIYAYDLESKARDSSKDFNTLSVPGSINPVGLWSNGTTLWVADNDGDRIYAYHHFQ